MVIGGGQAGGLTDRAVDIADGAAFAADDVMVVVVDPGLVPGQVSGRLDAADQPRGRQRVEDVVDGLERYIGEFCARRGADRFRVGVRMGVDGLHHGDTGSGDSQAGRA